MRSFFTIFFLLGFGLIQAQNILIKGRVLDAESKKSLPYVNIMMEKRAMGTSGNKEGVYALKVPDSILNENVRISFVGYYPKTISLNELSNGLVYLTRKTEGLDEVYISRSYEIKRNLKSTIRPDWNSEIIGIGNLNGGLYPSLIARHYPKPEKFDADCFLDELTIYFYQTKEQRNLSPKFRLHIYDVGEDGKPGEELLGNYLLERPENKSRLQVDLVNEKIRIPEEGFFIGLEHLFIKENQFREVKDFYINDSLVARDFATLKYAPVYRGILQSRNSEVETFYYQPGGWVRIDNWELGTEFFGNRVPAPVFKIKFTD